MSLRPITGWSIEPGTTRITDILDRIESDHDVVVRKPTDPAKPERWQYRGGIAEIVAFDSRFEAATLVRRRFAKREPILSFRPAGERVRVKISNGAQSFTVQGIADFADGRMLCISIKQREDSHVCMICRVEHAPPSTDEIGIEGTDATCLDAPDAVTVLVGSLAEVLDAFLDADGDISLLERR